MLMSIDTIRKITLKIVNYFESLYVNRKIASDFIFSVVNYKYFIVILILTPIITMLFFAEYVTNL